MSDKPRTATQILEDRTHFNAMLRLDGLTHEFVRRWQPEDKVEATLFAGELAILIRESVVRAQKPFIDAAAMQMANATPVVTLKMKDDVP